MLRRRKNKVLRFFARALSLLLSFLLLALLISNILQPLFYKDYYKRADKEFTAPGLIHGLVPQGFCFEETNNVFLSCGYMTNSEKASRIYITDGNGKNARFVELFNEDGSPYTGHTGGIAACCTLSYTHISKCVIAINHKGAFLIGYLPANAAQV